jgi:tetratricopeptide (TPR) repeat protein
MFVLRDKLFLACFIVAFALVPGWAQLGGLQQPGFPGTSPFPGLQTKAGLSGIITGSVRTLDNRPVPNARVEIDSLVRGQPLATQYTSSDGSFTLSNLPAGEYELKAESGVAQANERVQVSAGETSVTMRMPNARTAQGGDPNAPSVSVQQLRVPDKAVSLLAKARQAVDKNRLDDASKYVSKALQAYPHYAQAFALRGVLELQQQQFEQAAADASRAIEADPNYGAGYLVMGAVLNCQKKFQEALRPLQQAEVLAPNAWQGYFESSKALLQLGKSQQALQQINKALSLGDAADHPELHLVKGYAYLALRTYGGALSEFEQYLSHAPNGPYAAEARSLLEKVRPLAAAAIAR